MALELIKISEFEESVNLKEWLVTADANGIGYKISKANLEDELGISSLLQMGGAIVPASTPEATGDFFWIATEEGTYTNFGGVVVPAASMAVISRIDGVFTSSITTIPQPENKLEELQPSEELTAGDQRIYKGELHEALVNTSNNPKEAPSEFVNLLQFMRAIEAPIDGFGDEDQNVVNWIDKLGFTHLTLHKDSYPPELSTIGVLSDDYWDWAISDGNNIIQGQTKNGVLYPFVDGGGISPSPTQSLETYEQKAQPTGVFKDMLNNQWIQPLLNVDSEGNAWFSGVAEKGNIYVGVKYADGRVIRKRIGSILSNLGSYTSDDHNAPSILLDNRPSATYPIIIFQCDHNTTPMRYWRFTSLNPADWDIDSYQTIGLANVAYSQSFRYGDEIFVFSRRPPLPRPWRLFYSPDNGDTWQSRELFSSAASWLYMLCKEKSDGSGLNIAVHGHPQNSTDQSIYVMEMDYATGAVVNPANRANPLIADVRLSVADTGFVPIDPFIEGLKVYNATGTESTRLWDISTEPTGMTSVIFNVSPSKDRTMSNFISSNYVAVKFNLDNGNVNTPVILEEAGVPIELEDRGESMYFAGAALVDKDNAITLTWNNKSSIAGGDDIMDDTGRTIGREIDFTNVADIQKMEIIYSDLKVVRPYTHKGHLLVSEALKYNTYAEFYANTIINEIENLK